MSAPTPVNRAVMLERDSHACSWCGATSQLEANHRRAVGLGGSKIRPGLEDLITLCSEHNTRIEGDLHAEALRRGIKVPRWCSFPSLVPVFYGWAAEWWLLNRQGGRVGPIDGEMAEALMSVLYGKEPS